MFSMVAIEFKKYQLQYALNKFIDATGPRLIMSCTKTEIVTDLCLSWPKILKLQRERALGYPDLARTT